MGTSIERLDRPPPSNSAARSEAQARSKNSLPTTHRLTADSSRLSHSEARMSPGSVVASRPAYSASAKSMTLPASAQPAPTRSIMARSALERSWTPAARIGWAT